MHGSYSLLFDYREGGFPVQIGHFLFGFILLGALLILALAIHPGGRKWMQQTLDAFRLPFRIPATIFAVIYFTAVNLLIMPIFYKAYVNHATLVEDLEKGKCRRVEGWVEGFRRNSVSAARSTTVFVNFRVSGIRFRFSDRLASGYNDVDTPLRDGTPVRIHYCGPRKIIGRVEARLPRAP